MCVRPQQIRGGINRMGTSKIARVRATWTYGHMLAHMCVLCCWPRRTPQKHYSCEQHIMVSIKFSVCKLALASLSSVRQHTNTNPPHRKLRLLCRYLYGELCGGCSLRPRPLPQHTIQQSIIYICEYSLIKVAFSIRVLQSLHTSICMSFAYNQNDRAIM